MKTRTLLLLSLVCGLAIMLAGAVFLFQLSTQDDVAEPVAIGSTTTVGDMTVVVASMSEDRGRLLVEVGLSGARDDDPAGDFRLIASGRPLTTAGSDCEPTSATALELQMCTVEFDVTSADGSSRVLFYERGDEQARWVLG